MDLRARLQAELDRRRARNPRYSLRAFARHLGTHHSTLTRILERRRLTSTRVASLGARLGLSASQIHEARLHENSAGVSALIGRAGFKASSRWIATRTGLSLDDVNVALQSLLATGRITMRSATTWTQEHP